MRNFLLNAMAVLQAEAPSEGSDGGGAAPAQEPAQQPTQQPAQAPVQQEPAPQEEPGTAEEAVEYAETGDPTLDYVLGYVGSHGLGPDHPAIKAAQQGEFDQLEVELAKRDAKGYDKVLNLARKSYDGHIGKQKEAAEKTQEAIYQAVGGEEEWKAVSSWASENAEPEEKEAINKMFEQGGFAAQVAADFLARQYREASGTEYKGKKAGGDEAPANPGPKDTGPITRRELAEKAGELRQKYGEDYIRSPEYKALVKRTK